MNNIQDGFLSLPIAKHDRNIARSLGVQQPIPQVAERVQRNKLAVLVMHNYLKMMGIPSSYETSDCWNPIVQICSDTADIDIDGLGKIECRSLQIGESSCYVPPEVWEDRIGYVVVRCEEDERSATILGFVQQVSTEFVTLDRLEPIENLCEAIAALKSSIEQEPIQQVNQNVESIANLSNWLQDIFESGWQEIENLLDIKQSQYAYRTKRKIRGIASNLNAYRIKKIASNLTEIRRGRLFHLRSPISESLLALVVTITQISQNELDIRLSAYPISDDFLPEFLKLLVLDESGNVFLQAQARSIDNYIQIQFSGKIGESFSVQISLTETNLVENFVI